MLNTIASSLKKMIYGKKEDKGSVSMTNLEKDRGQKSNDSSTSASDAQSFNEKQSSSGFKKASPAEVIDLASQESGSTSFRNFQDQMRQIRLGQQFMDDNPELDDQDMINEQKDK